MTTIETTRAATAYVEFECECVIDAAGDFSTERTYAIPIYTRAALAIIASRVHSSDIEWKFDYARIEEIAISQGATEQEADAITDILHHVGWGGQEARLLDDAEAVIVDTLAWHREDVAESAMTDEKIR